MIKIFEISLPDYILIIVEVIHDPNDIRRSLNGTRGLNIPKKIKERVEKRTNRKIENELLIPIHFSIIKKPETKIIVNGKEKSLKKGVGAMQLYKFFGKYDELDILLQEIIAFFDEKKLEGKGWFKSLTNFQVIIGKDAKLAIEEDFNH
ncbi:MAG: hypothetical protein ACTSRP_06160 [Candidatus Helarchaeota archaeon]